MSRMHDGEQVGFRDGGPPEDHSEEELSRYLDLLLAAQDCPGHIFREVKKLIPEKVLFAISWNRWTYRSGE